MGKLKNERITSEESKQTFSIEDKVYEQWEVEFYKKKEDVLWKYYFNRDGPVFRKLGLNHYSYGEAPFDVLYDPEEIIPASMP